ncbi:MAG: metallophosphoesterase family protein [Planctomycetota bacterium]|nr:metallophosphoesterase family protein [Planctomycetota bacterium]
MPRLAIISDIHGNRVALEQVLRDCEVRNVDAIFCLGDIALLHPEVTKSWNPVARAGIAFARRTMSPDSLAFVGSLPSSFAISETVLGVHDSPTPTEDGMTYLRTKQDAAEAFGWFGERFCLVGHTHVPSCFTTGVKSARDSIGVTDVAEHDLHVHGHSVQGHSTQGHSIQGHSIVIELPKAGRSIINPGSVGQPRDRDPRASYAVLDIGRNLLELQRVEYDVAEVLRRSLAVGLPPIVGERLAMGA